MFRFNHRRRVGRRQDASLEVGGVSLNVPECNESLPPNESELHETGCRQKTSQLVKHHTSIMLRRERDALRSYTEKATATSLVKF